MKKKLIDLENKTNRLQSLNEVFLNLLKKQQREMVGGKQPDNYDLILHKYRKRYDYLDGPENPLNYEFSSKRRFGRSNSQLDMFNIKDIKYYKEPIKMMQDQLKAYIFQSTLDRRRDEYLMNEQINDIKSEVKNRLMRLENQHRLQMFSLANSIKTGEGYNNFNYLANRMFESQRERENLEQFMDEKLNGLSNFNRFSNNKYRDQYNNRYFHDQSRRQYNDNGNNIYNNYIKDTNSRYRKDTDSISNFNNNFNNNLNSLNNMINISDGNNINKEANEINNINNSE